MIVARRRTPTNSETGSLGLFAGDFYRCDLIWFPLSDLCDCLEAIKKPMNILGFLVACCYTVSLATRSSRSIAVQVVVRFRPGDLLLKSVLGGLKITIVVGG